MKSKSASIVRTIIAGATLLITAGIQAGTLHFNGTSAYVSVGSRPDLKLTGTTLTLEAWIKPTARGSDAIEGGVILCREGEYLLARFPDGTIRYAVATTTPGWAFNNTGTIVPTN